MCLHIILINNLNIICRTHITSWGYLVTQNTFYTSRASGLNQEYAVWSELTTYEACYYTIPSVPNVTCYVGMSGNDSK